MHVKEPSAYKTWQACHKLNEWHSVKSVLGKCMAVFVEWLQSGASTLNDGSLSSCAVPLRNKVLGLHPAHFVTDQSWKQYSVVLKHVSFNTTGGGNGLSFQYITFVYLCCEQTERNIDKVKETHARFQVLFGNCGSERPMTFHMPFIRP